VDEVTGLAVAAAKGDRVALDGFVVATQAQVWRFCAHLVGPGDADDVTQDVYLRAFAALPRYRADASARTWLLAIARRAAADHLRTRRRTRRSPVGLHRPDDSPEGQTTITAAVAGLEPDRRTAFVLTQVLGLSYSEAAQVCDCPLGTIRSRVARARADLIAVLAGGRRAEASS
jgi:RNA polymerase sigma-70 factor (ECF subfamily)